MTRLVLLSREVFKLGRVIGKSRAAGKMRVQAWQHASRSWSSPQAESTDTFGEIPGHSDLTPYQRRVVAAAQRSVNS